MELGMDRADGVGDEFCQKITSQTKHLHFCCGSESVLIPCVYLLFLFLFITVNVNLTFLQVICGAA